eukprot:scaffold195766_cov32-Prasinocladus_malaysianus.AAC.1
MASMCKPSPRPVSAMAIALAVVLFCTLFLPVPVVVGYPLAESLLPGAGGRRVLGTNGGSPLSALTVERSRERMIVQVAAGEFNASSSPSSLASLRAELAGLEGVQRVQRVDRFGILLVQAAEGRKQD